MIVYVCLLISCLLVLLCVCFVCFDLRLIWFCDLVFTCFVMLVWIDCGYVCFTDYRLFVW